MDGDSHTPDLMPNTFRRVEVITGVGRRRRWSVEEKMRIVAESCERSTTVSEVARRHGLNANQLFAWRRQFRQLAEERRNEGGATPQFVPLVSAAEVVDAGIAVAAVSAMIEVVGGGLTVRVPTGVDVATLQRVLGVVRRLA